MRSLSPSFTVSHLLPSMMRCGPNNVACPSYGQTNPPLTLAGMETGDVPAEIRLKFYKQLPADLRGVVLGTHKASLLTSSADQWQCMLQLRRIASAADDGRPGHISDRAIIHITLSETICQEIWRRFEGNMARLPKVISNRSLTDLQRPSYTQCDIVSSGTRACGSSIMPRLIEQVVHSALPNADEHGILTTLLCRHRW